MILQRLVLDGPATATECVGVARPSSQERPPQAKRVGALTGLTPWFAPDPDEGA